MDKGWKRVGDGRKYLDFLFWMDEGFPFEDVGSSYLWTYHTY